MSRYRRNHGRSAGQSSYKGRHSRAIILGLSGGAVLFVIVKLVLLTQKLVHAKQEIDHLQSIENHSPVIYTDTNRLNEFKGISRPAKDSFTLPSE